MRIIAGKFRGRTLFVPDTKDTRPTMDRARESVFNILRSAEWALKPNGDSVLTDAHVLDVFAGSGAMGFEALSQGAAHVTFIENSAVAVEAIKKNIDKIGLKDTTKIIKADVLKVPAGAAAGVAFFDPPYGLNLLEPALIALTEKNHINADTLLVLEMQKREDPNEELVTVLDTRRYGVSKIVFAKLK